MSYADQLFIKIAKTFLKMEYGIQTMKSALWEDGTPAHTIKKFGIVNRYDRQRNFGDQALRRTYFKSAVDELLWIWQKKVQQRTRLKSHIWDSWADETGSIGKAYGYQLGVKHHYKGRFRPGRPYPL